MWILLIIWVAFLGYTQLSLRYLKLPCESMPLWIVSGWTVLLHVAALWGYLVACRVSLLSIGTVSFLMACIQLMCEGYKAKQTIQPLTTFSFLGFLLLVILSAGFVSQAEIRHNDALVFWGSISHYVYLSNVLPTARAPIAPQFLIYPLGTALFQNLFLQASAHFHPPLALLAQDILWLAPLMIFFIGRTWRESSVLLPFLLLLIYLFHPAFLDNLMVDRLLSVYFAALIFLPYAVPNIQQRWLLMIPGLWVLPLIKLTGLIFAMIVYAHELCLVLNDRSLRISLKQKILFGLNVVGLSLLIFTWYYHYRHLGLTTQTHSLLFSNILQEIMSARAVLLQQIFLAPGSSNGIPLFVFYGLCAYLSYAAIQYPLYRKTIGCLWAGGIVYLIILYLFEAVTFSAGSTGELPAFGRYYATYWLAVSLVTLVLNVQARRLWDQAKWRRVAYLLLLVLLLAGFTLRQTQPTERLLRAQRLTESVRSRVSLKSGTVICVINNFEGQNFHDDIALMYTFIPSFLKVVRARDGAKALKACDYVLIYPAGNAEAAAFLSAPSNSKKYIDINSALGK